MTTDVHYGHISHLEGSPTVTEAAAALVSVPDGASCR
jgi:guanine deaminase